MTGFLKSGNPKNGDSIEVMYGRTEIVNIAHGDATIRTFYIKNIDEKPIFLEFDTSKWDPPEALNYVDVSWDYDGEPIMPGAISRVNMMVICSDRELNDFSFIIDFISHSVVP